MKVLHVINDLRLAGAERLVADLSRAQAANGLTVSVAPLSMSSSGFEDAVRSANVPLLLPEKPMPIRSPAHIPRLAKLFPGFDIVHVHLFPAQLWAVCAATTLGKSAPVLVTTEHNTHNGRRGNPLLRPVDAAMYARYARIAAISDATRDALTAYLPATAAKISVVTNGIDTARFAQTGSAAERATLFPNVSATASLLLSIGRLEVQKDFPTLLRAVALVPNAHLAIIGDGVLRGDLEALAAFLGIRERVRFLGKRGDIPALLRNADLYVQPSLWEGFGIAAVEAMASGLPVVASDVPGLREVVGDAGVLVKKGSADGFASAMNRLLADADARTVLSQKARARAESFTIEACQRAYQTFYLNTQHLTPNT